MIDIRGLGYRYAGAAQASLREVDLQVPRGGVFGLLGPNGAGKTTLISLLNGTLRLQSGEVSVAGLDLATQLPEVLRISALVPQDYAFYPRLSAAENLRFFGHMQGVAAADLAARIEYAVEVCGLQEVLQRRAGEYSGGVKRRLNLAIGLLNAPRVLYLDEPTVGIDLQSRAFILDAIRQLRDDGLTVVYTSHYMEEIQQICQHVAIIDHGRVLVCEPLQALIARGADKRLRIELEATPDADVLAGLPAAQVEGRTLTFESLPDDLPLDALLARVRKQGIRQLHYGAESLEQIYLGYTQRDLRD